LQEVGALFCIEEGVGLVLDDVAEFPFFLILVLAALLQLLESLDVEVFAEAGDAALEVDPACAEARPLELPVSEEAQLFGHDGRRGIVSLVLLDGVLVAVLVRASGGDGEFLVVMLAQGQLEVVHGEGVPPIPAHELGGRFDEEPSLEFHQSLEEGLLLPSDILHEPLRLHDMMYEIRVGK
jgi:hypothetical protein